MINHDIYATCLITLIRKFLAARTFLVRIDNALSNVAAAPIGFPQGSIIGSLAFPVIINDLPCELQLFYSTFADDTKTEGKTTGVGIIQSDLLKTVKWAAIIGVVLNASKSQHRAYLQA